MTKTLAVGILAAILTSNAFAIRLNDQVQLMSEEGRRGFISLLLKKSGSACSSVRRTFYQGSLDAKSSVWNAGCDARNNYAVVFQDDGSNTTRVLKCSELKSMGAPAECFNKF